MRSPVLFLVFNRPETTRLVFDSIRKAQPPRLYIVADGPRANRPAEALRCNEVREICSSIDWPCEVKTLFRSNNLGCKIAVSQGITWFFNQEPEGVILEDDVLPTATFFDYCDELLEKYRHEPKVSLISGSNLVSNLFSSTDSYFFSRYPHIWGWAGWRRVWQNYDVALAEWPTWRDSGGLERWSGGKRVVDRYWRRLLDSTHEGDIDTWDYQLFFTCWRFPGLTVLPTLNQTQNLGFGATATHTTRDAPEFVHASAPQPLTFPLVHPIAIERQMSADALIEYNFFGINRLNAIKRYLRELPILHKWAMRREAARFPPPDANVG